MSRITFIAVLLGFLYSGSAYAQCDIEDFYVARLSAADHFNTNGIRLTDPVAIIRQDRANYHLYKLIDGEDQSDRFFASKENRAILENMLQNGRSTPVVNGTPLILVTVCRDSRSEYITAAVIDEPEQCDQKESYVARLGAADHFNSSGERLTQAPAIIRQDRANNFVFEKRDLEDQADDFFGLKDNRETLENLLESGRSSPDTLNEIVNGTPLVLVNLCKGNRGDYVNATIIEK